MSHLPGRVQFVYFVLDLCELKLICDLYRFTEQIFFRKKKTQKQFPLKINEKEVYENKNTTISIEDSTRWFSVVFFRKKDVSFSLIFNGNCFLYFFLRFALIFNGNCLFLFFSCEKTLVRKINAIQTCFSKKKTVPQKI